MTYCRMLSLYYYSLLKEDNLHIDLELGCRVQRKESGLPVTAYRERNEKGCKRHEAEERERDKGAKKHNGKINLLLTAMRTKGIQGRK
jgi:hypothetical protein